MTQAELANKLGISFQGIAQWEYGCRNPKPKTLEKIAQALEVPLVELTGTVSAEKCLMSLQLAALALNNLASALGVSLTELLEEGAGE